MYLTVQALVLRITQYNDTDALITLLTNKYGKLTAKARGLRRKNSSITAACQLLSYGEFVLFENRGLYTINEAHPIELFHDLRTDIEKLALGTYFAQVTEVICQEDIPNPQLQSLTLNCLYALCKLLKSDLLIKAVFELRSACLAGYTPDLSGCTRCGSVYADRFDISAGRLECTVCRSHDSDGIRMPVSPGAVDAMRYICFCDEKQLFSFDVGEGTVKNISQVAESYLSTQLERGFSTLDFYKSLFIEK